MRRHHITDAKVDFDRLLDEAQSEPIGIERRGRICAVLVGLARHQVTRARRVELESELRQAREMLEKLRDFVPKDADAFLLDGDADPEDASRAMAAPPEPADAEPKPEAGPRFDEVPPRCRSTSTGCRRRRAAGAS
jgi:antitoxin (DNA-binding transcriptional repressor) of toxin-antitoxin stability system